MKRFRYLIVLNLELFFPLAYTLLTPGPFSVQSPAQLKRSLVDNTIGRKVGKAFSNMSIF